MVQDTDEGWEKWGSTDPYYAVLTDQKFRKQRFDSDTSVRSKFFDSGKDYIEQVFKTIRTHLHPAFQPRKAVDFGCGVGRLLIPLARICEEVIGVDVSDSMLLEARKNCESRSIQNFRLVKSDDDLSRLSGKFDLIHSFIVFQHIPTHRGQKIFENLIAHLTDGGVAALHFTFMRKASIIRKIVNWKRRNIPLANGFVNLILGRKFSEPMIQMYTYNLNKIFFTLRERGFDHAYAEIINMDGYYSVILYFQKQEQGLEKEEEVGPKAIRGES